MSNSNKYYDKKIEIKVIEVSLRWGKRKPEENDK